MIKTKAVEKLVKYLNTKKVKEFRFELIDGKGKVTTWRAGVRIEAQIVHDDLGVKIVETKTKWL